MKLLIQWAVTSSALILITLAVRRLFQDKLSARLRYALWLVVLARLLVPFQVELSAKASQSVPLLATNMAPKTVQWEAPSIPVFPQSSRPAAEYNGITFDLMEPGEIMSTETSMGYYQRSEDGETIIRYLDVWSPAQIVGAVWGGGAALMALVLLASNLHFALRLRRRRKTLEVPDVPLRVYTAEGLPSPCLFGVFRPAVYVTPEAAENPDALRHVLAHELTHYAHKDHIWSLLRCLALALHWYNPLVWLAVVLSKGDGELACDEGAVARLGDEERISYGRTLVDMVAARSARPADLLSCSTAMTGGKKSIQQRVAQLVKKPKTVKIALFAAVAVVALSVVFVFAERSSTPGNSDALDAFLAQVENAVSIYYHDPSPFHSDEVFEPIVDYDLLPSAKAKLADMIPIGQTTGPVPDPKGAKNAPQVTICPTSDGAYSQTYRLLLEDGYTYLLPMEEDTILARSTEKYELAEFIKSLSRTEYGRRLRGEVPQTGSFLAQLEEAQGIFIGQPLYYSSIIPGVISDPEFLAQAKALLAKPGPVYWLEPDGGQSGGWEPLSLDSNHPPELITFDDLNDQFFSTGHSLGLYPDKDASQSEQAGRYWLVEWKSLWLLAQWDAQNDARPFTVLGYYGGNTVSQLKDLARQQTELNRDPSLPKSMTQEELKQYDAAFLRKAGVTQLQGRPDSMEGVTFHAGYTTPEQIQLWYWGDETHNSVWVLALSKDGDTLLADQPIEVFNAALNAAEEASYEQLGPGAFAAFLRPEEVVSVTAGNYFPGQAVTLDIQTLKDQLVRALYHQRSAEYAEEKYGRYVLTLCVEKDVGYYLHDGGRDGLILSAGSEPDIVCLRHRILASPDGPMTRYVYSPELYQTIRNLFD